MDLVSGNIYSAKIATSETLPQLLFNGKGNFDSGNSYQTVNVNITNGYVYKTTTQVTTTGDDNNKWNVSGSEYNPVSVKSVEFLKDEVSNIDTEAPYSYQFSGLAGTEKFLIKVNYDDNTSKTYTVSSGTNLTEGTTGFSLDSKIINTIMTVNFEGTTATSYSLSSTVNDAITSVTLDGSTPLTKTSAPYTFNNVYYDTSGYTVIVKTKRNTNGTSYTFSNTSAGAGTYTLSQGETPFYVSSGLTTFNATVNIDSSTLKATSIDITDPNAVISSVRLVRRDGNETITLTSKDGGLTWTWNGYVKTYNGSGSTNDRSYQLVVNNAGTDQKWYYNSDDYGFEAGNTYASTSNWKTTTGNERFRFKGDDKYQYKITVTLTADKKEITSLRYKNYVEPSAKLHMPLSEKDFANGPRYFLVGSRTADWCLQPEWELTANGNTATLSGRFMQMQIFGIAKVDDYDDYIFQEYTLFANDGTEVYDNNKSNITLKNMGASGAIRYDNETLYPHGTDNSLKWMVGVENWNDKWTAYAWTNAPHSYINKLTVTLDSNGNPTNLSFNSTTDAATLSAHRVLTLVGSDIKYDGNYDFGGNLGTENLDEMGRFWKNGNRSNITGWSNSWIQCDPETNRPYVDALGNTVYLTAYDKEWLENHYTWFYNSSKNLIYKSTDVTFFPADKDNDEDEYADVYNAHPGVSTKIGNTSITSGEFQYTEKFTNYDTNHDTDVTNSDWACYVVKDMWMSGNFKIWTGSGQGIKYWNTVNDAPDGETGGIDHGAEKAIQWFFENGGHGTKKANKEVKGSDLTIKGVTADMYPTKRDIEDANFRLEKMTYFPRVIFWYNPTEGFDGSVLQLVEAACGPNIQAFYNTSGKKNTLRYQWWIKIADATDTSHDNDVVTNYTITRYTYDSNGKEVVDGIVENNKALPSGTKVSDLKWDGEGDIPFTDTYKNITAFVDDSHSLAPGTYFYRVSVTINGTEKKAKSNELPIYEASVPVTMSVEQQMEGDNYTFNLEYKAEPVDEKLSMAFGDGTVADAMKYYVITVDEATATRLNNASKKSISFTQVTTESIYLSDATKLAAGTWYAKVEITDKDNAALNYVWSGITPNSNGTGALKTWNADKTALIDLSATDAATYSFTTYLVSADNDIAEWALLNFDAASDNTDIVAPAANLAINSVNVQKATRQFAHEHKDNLTHPSGARLSGFNDDGTLDADNPVIASPIKYTRFNETVAPATIDALPVTESVTDNYAVNYRLYLMPETASLDGNYSNAAFNADLNGINGDARNEVSLNLYDIDLSSLNATEDAVDGYGKRIKANAAATFDSYIIVEYAAGGKTFVNADGTADKEIPLNAAMNVPTVNNKDIIVKNYEDFYYHMSPDELEAAGKTDDWEGMPAGKLSLGFYAAAAADLTYSLDGSDLEAYAAFHMQQKALYNEGHKGVYGHTPDTNNGGHASYIHSFAGTRAANGGHPLSFAMQSSTSTIEPLNGYIAHEGGEQWADTWNESNDWSTLAVNTGRLPLHINPAHYYGTENPGDNVPPSTVISGNFAAVYPVVKGERLSCKVNAPAAVNAADAAISTDLYLFQAVTPVTLNLSLAKIATGVEDIIAGGDDAPVEYYNLQGIRVMNPAKGQIYIVRQGTKVSKTLLK